jgi:DNA-binding beta-propeller fold protein YncE
MYRMTMILATLWLSVAAVELRAGEDTDPYYRVLTSVKLGGEGGWDYLTVDPDAHRLYISRADRVMVVDTKTNTVIHTIPKTPGVHGIALVKDQGKGFISCGGDSTVTVFDLDSLKTTDHVKVGQRPDCIIYDPGSKRVFTFNAGSKDASAIDPESLKVVGSVPLGGKPEFAAADGKGMVYVNVEDKDEIVAFDSKELKEKSRWPIAPGHEPSGLSMDREGRRLFSTCGNKKMVVLDADSGKVVTTLDIGDGTDACAYDPELHHVFSSNRDGTLTVVKQASPDNYNVMQNLKTQRGARTMAVDTTAHRVYLVTAKAKPNPTPPPEGQRRRRPTFEPGSFTLIIVGHKVGGYQRVDY